MMLLSFQQEKQWDKRGEEKKGARMEESSRWKAVERRRGPVGFFLCICVIVVLCNWIEFTFKWLITWNEWSLTHAVDFVVDEVAIFTQALETTREVVTFLVTSRRKLRICTLVNVCPINTSQNNIYQQPVHSFQKVKGISFQSISSTKYWYRILEIEFTWVLI